MALSIEHCNLHRRIALNAIRVVGLSPRLLMLGFMLPTFFLSMWISNNATTAMMLPILEAVLLEMEQNDDVEAIVDIKDVGIDSDSGEIREEARPRGVDGGGCSSDDEEFEQVIKQSK